MDEIDNIFEKIPSVEEFGFWLIVNAILFVYVGVQELSLHYGPGTILSTGAILLGILYGILFLVSKSEDKLAREAAMALSFFAILGDFAAVIPLTGTSVLLDLAGFLLFYSAYKGIHHPP